MTFLFERAPGISKEATDWSATVRESGPRPEKDPQTVMRDDQNWQIDVEWEEHGAATGLPGNWLVDAYVESIGPGQEVRVGGFIDPFAAGPHSGTISVPASTVNVTPGENSTPFLLIITLTANNGAGGRYNMAGFEMGPVLQFYTP